jgi:hypothetical protein
LTRAVFSAGAAEAPNHSKVAEPSKHRNAGQAGALRRSTRIPIIDCVLDGIARSSVPENKAAIPSTTLDSLPTRSHAEGLSGPTIVVTTTSCHRLPLS